MNQRLFESVDLYISSLLAIEDEYLLAVRKSIEEAEMPQISISANQGKFLYMMALLKNANRILELGTLGGYSTIWMAKALPENGKLVTIELNPIYAEVAQKNFINAGLNDKIEILIGNATDRLSELISSASKPFDMIFIDADKPPYADYFQLALKLSKPGSLIIADNVIREGKVIEENSQDEKVHGVRKLNKMLSECIEIEATILQMVGVKEYDGMAIAIVK
jgi:caffeoyl-CoA O-methyltransferase